MFSICWHHRFHFLIYLVSTDIWLDWIFVMHIREYIHTYGLFSKNQICFFVRFSSEATSVAFMTLVSMSSIFVLTLHQSFISSSFSLRHLMKLSFVFFQSLMLSIHFSCPWSKEQWIGLFLVKILLHSIFCMYIYSMNRLSKKAYDHIVSKQPIQFTMYNDDRKCQIYFVYHIWYYVQRLIIIIT